MVPNLFGTRDPFHGRQSFHGLEGGEGWFQDDSCSFVVHFISMTFTSVPLGSPGIRSQRLGTTGVGES